MFQIRQADVQHQVDTSRRIAVSPLGHRDTRTPTDRDSPIYITAYS